MARKAESQLTGFLLTNPQNVQALNILGVTKNGLGKFSDAKMYFNRAIEIEPNNAEAYYHRGQLNLMLGEWANAAGDYRRSLEIDPNFTVSQEGLSQAEGKIKSLPVPAKDEKAMIDKKIIVISHERSGTHFLMNTIADNFDYESYPALDFDIGGSMNLYHSAQIAMHFSNFRGRVEKRIAKSHLHICFFSQLIESLAEEYKIFYVYRDPRDVLLSYWRFISRVPWNEGPYKATIGEFIRATPTGGMLRFQDGQPETIYERWQAHMRGYLVEAPQKIRSKINFVSYEDLNKNFDQTVTHIGDILEVEAAGFKRPEFDQRVVFPSEDGPGKSRHLLSDDDNAYIAENLHDDLKEFFPELS